LGAYVHLPFCVERCGYCSFNTAPYTPLGHRRFLTALLAEWDRLAPAPWAGRVSLDTVLLAGGSPSTLTVDQMQALLGRIGERFAIEGGAEITVECNPDDVTVERLAGYRRAGVDRVSLGVQSVDDRILPRLDRRHSAGQARAAFEAARAAGLRSLDLATWTATVREVLAWGPDHLSAYGLTLDEGSLWHARGVSDVPPEET